MTARLVPLDGTEEIPIAGVLTIVGRHRGCDVRLDSSRVSRRHCCLALGVGEVIVRDLGSTNGIRINGVRVDEGQLRPGDVLAIAHLRFRLAWTPDGPGNGPRPPGTDPGADGLPHLGTTLFATFQGDAWPTRKSLGR